MNVIYAKYFTDMKKNCIWFLLALVYFGINAAVSDKLFIPVTNMVWAIIQASMLNKNRSNHWEQYAAALPGGRKNVVGSYFIIMLANQIFISVFSLICYIVGKTALDGRASVRIFVITAIGFTVGTLLQALILTLSFCFAPIAAFFPVVVMYTLLSGIFMAFLQIVIDRILVGFLLIFVAVAVYYLAYRFTLRRYEWRDIE